MSVPEPIAQPQGPVVDTATEAPADAAPAAASLHAVPAMPASPPAPAASLAQALELLGAMIPGVRAAYVGLDRGRADDFSASQCWPTGEDPDPAIVQVASAAASDNAPVSRTVTAAGPAGTTAMACPLKTRSGRDGALAIITDPVADDRHDTVLKLLEWAAAWLALVAPARAEAPPDEKQLILDVIDAGFAERSSKVAATAMAHAVASANGCERVSIALLDGDRLELVALSSGARFDPRTQLCRDIVAAMEEALDDGEWVVLPTPNASRAQPSRAHDRLLRGESLCSVCSVVLRDGERAIGVLTLERSRGPAYDGATMQRLAPVASRIANLLGLRRSAERSLRARLRESTNNLFARALGPGSARGKLAALIAILAIGALALLDGDHRVTAVATLEGAVHRTLVAPVDGYVSDAPVRAGDAVKAGDLLATLDTRELEHERRRWMSERAEIEKSYRQAVATMERSKVRVLKARLGKADAQLALIRDQLTRTRVEAPFDGLVVSGDLSHALGAPVTRGDVLFEVAPLDDYRIDLAVDERDIDRIEPGQTGQLALTALPEQPLAFTVEKVVGVADAEEGRNVFRVEARLDADAALLRPGMHGVGKIHVGRERLLWVWTHELTERIRLWMWSNAP